MQRWLEVCTGGVWGTVCSNDFANTAAYVACKQLGLDDVNGMFLYNNHTCCC